MLKDSSTRRVSLAFLCALALPLAAAAAEKETTESFLARYFTDCLDQPGDYSCLEEYWVADKVGGVQRSEEVRRSVFPDLDYEIIEILVDGDRAAVRCVVTGTAAGTAPAADGAASSGRQLEIDEAFFYEVKDGKIQNSKPFSDRWTVARALGYTITPPANN